MNEESKKLLSLYGDVEGEVRVEITRSPAEPVTTERMTLRKWSKGRWAAAWNYDYVWERADFSATLPDGKKLVGCHESDGHSDGWDKISVFTPGLNFRVRVIEPSGSGVVVPIGEWRASFGEALQEKSDWEAGRSSQFEHIIEVARF